MEVFISWSGERSRCFAEALRSWIPKIINAVAPWLSSADIDKGARWSADVASKLESAKVGIICLTPSNVHSDWILFEAGAPSKTLKSTFVCPLLIGLEPPDIKGPLAQFQASRSTKDEIKKLIITINSALGEKALSDGHVDEAFEVWWPKLQSHLQNLPPDEGPTKQQRPDREILEEVLALVRSQARATRSSDFEREPLATWQRRISDALNVAAKELELVLISWSVSRGADGFTVTVKTDKGEHQFELPADSASVGLLVRRIRRRLMAPPPLNLTAEP